ncbi:MAG: hypothetical protein MSC45_05255 [Mobiluncus sp.]|uniref:hypothetical protein n=1 Tax=Mobiluncus sp. TaxID=47293 RepID=UPI00258E71B1|nr:hypothetical protein [Mobiluncus sp.]MCI6584458.1 hypothetical protein [Mobiluncus sp.]
MGIFDGLRQAWAEAGEKVEQDAKAKARKRGARPIDWDTWDKGRYVAGVTFHQKEIMLLLASEGMRGDPCRGQAFYLTGIIEPEPGNRKDPGAIACKSSGIKIGYIPKENQAAIRARTPKGNNWSAKATYAFWPKDGVWVVKYWL